MAAYVTNWLEDVVRPNLAPTTCAKYETFSRLYIVPGIGAKRLDRLQVRDVQTWLNRVRTACQCCAQGKDAADPKMSGVAAPLTRSVAAQTFRRRPRFVRPERP